MKKILLIEDDSVMRENTAEILTLAGYEVTTAKNGQEGIAVTQGLVTQKSPPDLILCDILMPKLDGYGVLTILSKNQKTAGIPFIFLTAKTERGDIRKGMNLGADDYLTKPFEEAELLSAVESRLKKNEWMKKEFAADKEGLHAFLDEAKGLQELAGLSAKRPVVRYKKKEMIFHEGDMPQHLFFLNSGKVKTYRSHDDGKEYATDVFKKGDFFGYIPLLEKTPYSDSAVVLEECEICKIPSADFLTLIYKNRDVAAKFIQMLSNRVDEREKQLLSLAYDTVRKRIAEALLVLEERYAESGRKPARISVSREDLASMAGTAQETVIRTLSEFKAERLLAIEGRGIVILDPKKLRAVQY